MALRELRTWRGVLHLWLPTAAGVLLASLLGLQAPDYWGQPPAGGIAIVIVAAAWLFWFRPRWRARSMIQLLSPMNVRFDDNGVEWMGAQTESRIAWAAVEGVWETRQFLFLQRGAKKSFAHIVPTRTMDATARERVRAIVRAHVAGRTELTSE
jgi:hypothetical protein